MTRNHYIGVIAALLIVGAGAFYAGKTTAVNAQGAQRGQFAAGEFTGRSARVQGLTGGFTGGTIVSTANGSIAIKQQNGSSTEIVLVTPTTQIFKQAAGTAADLSEGTAVSVTGTPNSDG